MADSLVGLRPYYQDDAVTIYHADCRDVLPFLDIETVITDPMWPGAEDIFEGFSDSPERIFRDMCALLPASTKRMVVHLGCDTDPRFLQHVPERLSYLRTCWLDYAVPSYKGRLLYTGDVAHAFGCPPEWRKGRSLMPGKCTSGRQEKQFIRHSFVNGRHRPRSWDGRQDGMPHPCPRRLEHVLWLVNHFSDRQVVDPFCGSGTTAVAAKQLGKMFIGCEINESYCEIAVERLAQTVMELGV